MIRDDWVIEINEKSKQSKHSVEKVDFGWPNSNSFSARVDCNKTLKAEFDWRCQFNCHWPDSARGET